MVNDLTWEEHGEYESDFPWDDHEDTEDHLCPECNGYGALFDSEYPEDETCPYCDEGYV